MSRKLFYLIVTTASILVLFITAIFNGITPSKPAIQVITVKEATTLTEPARIDLFINELMTPRKAACLKWILVKESHMNPLAKNPTSTAKGVGQFETTGIELETLDRQRIAGFASRQRGQG